MSILHILAAARIDPNSVNNLPTTNSTDVLVGTLNIVYFAAGAVGVIVIILAGFTFITSVYDPAKVTQAKNALLYSIVGLVVVIAAFFLTQFVVESFK